MVSLKREEPVVVLDSGVVSAERRPSRKRRMVRRVVRLYPFVVLFIAAAFGIASRVKTQSVAYVPGSASDLSPLIKITGEKQYPPKGHFLLATVGLTDRLTVTQWVRAKLDPDTDLRAYSDVYPTGRANELKRGRVMMDDSKLIATLAALRYLGRDGEGSGVRIVEVAEKLPAFNKVEVGDVVTEVDGERICVAGDLGAAIAKKHEGDPVHLTITRKGSPRPITLDLVPRPIQGQHLIGVAVETVSCKLPIDVHISTANIGGPSAGLSMTLAILDRLTPGELTGGTVVAATGTISADGKVGDVGGVRQKTAGVRSAGAKLFLVPPGEEQDARARAGDLPVVAVTTLDQAVTALHQYGGQPLPSPRVQK